MTNPNPVPYRREEMKADRDRQRNSMTDAMRRAGMSFIQ